MKYFSTLLLLLALLCFFSCQDDDVVIDDAMELELDIVTGIQLRDVNGQPIGVHGNPNTFSGEIDVFPNPAIEAVSVLFFGVDNLRINQFWVFPANINKSYSAIDYVALLDNDTYSADEVSDENTVLTDVVNEPNFTLDVSTLNAGYYRMFYLLEDGRLFWDNFYVDPTSSDVAALQNQVIEDWQ